mgnify:CR=1 FL=1
MAKDRKGNDKPEYPKLIRVEGKPGKVRVMNAEEEAAAQKPDKKADDKKAAGWDK